MVVCKNRERKENEKRKEKGMMTVEAVLCLVPFILAILGIISFANIFMVHSRVQHAIYESASELTAYTYLYQVSGWRSADETLNKDSAKLTELLESFDEARAALSKVTGSELDSDIVDDAVDKVEDTIDKGKEMAKNPKELLQEIISKLLSVGSGAIKDKSLEWIGDLLVRGYLDTHALKSGGQSADEYLKAFGVKEGVAGLDYGNSKLFADDGLRLIDIVVEYDLEIYFFKLFLKDPTIHVVQRVTVPAWLDGDGGTFDAG